MDMITQVVSANTTNITELLRVVWMEIAMASFAATVYFTFSGWLATSSQKPKSGSRSDQKKSGGQTLEKVELNDTQLVTKFLRQGNIKDAIALLQEVPEVVAGSVPANVAPRLLMAAAKAPDSEDATKQMSVFTGKIEARSLEAVVLEALKNKDVAAGRVLQQMSRVLSIPKTVQTLESLAKVLASDATCLRNLMEEAEVPLARPFAKAVLEACTTLKDVDLASEVFEKAPESDAEFLRSVVEKAATNPAHADTGSIESSKNGIRACGKIGDLEGAVKIFEQLDKLCLNTLMYNHIMDACVECGNLEKAMEYFNEARSAGSADSVSFNTAMKGYLAQGQVAKAKSLLAELSEKGLSPTHGSFHGILNFYANAGNREAAWKLVQQMQLAGVLPTAVTCAILLKGKLNSPADIRNVLEVVDTIKPMDEVLFHALAEACIRTGQLNLLSKYQARLASQGNSVALTAPTYGCMIKAYGQVHDMKNVWSLWAELNKHKIQPTAITFGCMVEALVTNRCTADAWTLVQEMRSEEATRTLVNTVIYSTVLKGFAYAKRTDKVMALYEEMRAQEIHPNNITYNTILNAFAQGGAMDRVPALLEDMKSAVPPAEPDLVTYSTILKGYCNSGCLDRALEIYKDMLADGKLSPDEVMYNSLLDGCAKEQRPNEALKLLEDMKKQGVAPSNYTLSMVVKLMGRCRRLNQAFSITEDLSRQYGLKVNIQVYTCLISACFNNRQATKAVALHDQIIKEGLSPDEMTYSVLVQGCLRAGLVDKAAELTKFALGPAAPKVKGAPPGINAHCRDELSKALGASKANTLFADAAKGQVTGALPRPSSPPWRQQRA